MKSSQLPTPRFLSVPEAGSICGVSRNTVYNWVRKGVLDAYQTPGRTNLIRPGDLILFMRKNGMFVPNQLLEIAKEDEVSVGFSPKSGEPDAVKLPVVLCIDDEARERAACANALKGLAEVLPASTGFEGLHILTVRDDVSIALIDLTLRGMTGEETFIQAKALRPAIPLIAMSKTVPQFTDAVLVNGVLQKPLKPQRLRETLLPFLSAAT